MSLGLDLMIGWSIYKLYLNVLEIAWGKKSSFYHLVLTLFYPQC